MIALLVILFAAGTSTLGEVMNWPPKPKPTAPIFAIAPESREIRLEWNASPTPGCSNVVFWGYQPDMVNNPLPTGTNTNCVVRVFTDHAQYFTVRAVLDGRLSEPSNMVKYPGDVIRSIYVLKPDGSKLTLDTFTNTPPGEVALWKLNVSEWERFDAP